MLNLPKPMDSRQAVLIGHGMDLLQTKHRAIVLSAASVPETCTSAVGQTMPPTGHGVTRLHFKKFVALFQLTVGAIQKDNAGRSKSFLRHHFHVCGPVLQCPSPQISAELLRQGYGSEVGIGSPITQTIQEHSEYVPRGELEQDPVSSYYARKQAGVR
ncbi:MAG: uncharacterized protein KVP18_003136 [Porospora cf. gigantea A]|uniref:uncharacterized protein n=1 Tax=Porospora cf. gigantea A TaxID=2853593 RepID=UPI00355ACA55|nr:MAG: hypothetical protein KVP18_003136 [Porospora cf. gigantea A]